MATTLAFDLIAHDRASDKFDKIGNSASTTGDKFRKMGRVAALGAAALAAGAVVAGKALFDMTKNAAADEAAQRKLAIGIKNATGATDKQIASVEEWISAQGVALGVTDDELRPALQRLVEATGDVDEAQRQLGIAMDVSAGTGKSLKVVSEALMKANNGTTASLSKLGLKTKDAEGNALSLDDALKKMSQTFEGQAAAKAETLEGKMGRLNLMFDEAKEAIGARLIPVATDLADWFIADGLPAIQKFGDWMQDNIIPTLQDLGEFIGEKVVPVLKDFADFIVDYVVPYALTVFEGAIEGVKGFLDNLGDSLQENKPFLEALGTAIKETAIFLLDKLGPALAWIYENVLPALGTAIGGAITIVQKLTSWWLNMAEWGIRSFSFLLDAAFAAFEGILTAAEKGLGWVPKLGDKISNAKDSFSTFRDKTVGNLEDVADKLANVHDKINGIPDSKNVDINVNVKWNNLVPSIPGINPLPGGPILPRADEPSRPRSRTTTSSRTGSDEDALYRAVRRALSEQPIYRMPNSGQGAYLTGADF